MTDIDHVVTTMPAIEYDHCKAVAIVEYKFGLGHLDLNSANIAAMDDLAKRANLPFFVVQYDATDWEFLVRPRNDEARTYVPKRAWMDEQEYVTLLHAIRGRSVPPDLLARLSAVAENKSEEETVADAGAEERISTEVAVEAAD